MARMFADVEPLVRTGEVDITVDDMRLTVEQFYERAEKERATRIDLAMDAHLSEIFLSRKPREGRPAADIVAKYRRDLTDKITYWTGVRRPVVRGLVDAIWKNCERLKLWGVVGQEPSYLVELTAFGTTLAMNFLQRGNFTGDKRRKPVKETEQTIKTQERKARAKDQRARAKELKKEQKVDTPNPMTEKTAN
jgi:hypothetical protein